MKRIISQSNILIKTIKKLKTKKGRDFQGCYIVEGEKLIEEAVTYEADITHILYTEDFDFDKKIAQIENREKNRIELIETDRKTFSSISDTETPQGLLAVVRKPDFRIVGDNWLILDRIQDPGNLGTIIRTADAAGFGTVIAIKGGSDIYAPKVVRASAGAFFRVGSTTLDNAEAAVKLAEKHGKRLIVADSNKGIDCFETDLTKPFALIIGNEGEGLNTFFIDKADLAVKIPMGENCESLNAAIAASVIMFEALRQTRYQ
jgi:TrmH family RNA methyltransferase